MKLEICEQSGFSVVNASFCEGEVLYTQPKAMLCMTPGLTVSAHIGGSTTNGGFVGGVKSMLSGESLAISRYQAKREGEALTIAPSNIGEVRIEIFNGTGGYFLTKGAYLAHEEGVILTPKFSGLKGWMSNKGLFLLHASGIGHLCISSFGAIVQRKLSDGEVLIVDNEYVVAFSDDLSYELRTMTKSVSHSLMSGEGLVNRYTGPGTLLYQTRSRQRTGIISTMLNIAT